MNDPALDIASLEAQLPELKSRFSEATPFHHVVIDDLLPADVFAAACDEFDRIGPSSWKHYVHVNERKHAHIQPSAWGEHLAAIYDALQSDRFVRFLEQLSGIEGLMSDPDLDGGGLHRMPAGGHLNIHADFTAHHRNHNWQRRINMLLYLNREYDSSWGGELELWPADMSECATRVAPIGNRMLVFRTDTHSFHGHPEPLRFPDGRARQSLALYYFSEEPSPLVRSTDYQPRPGDGARAAAIRLDNHLLRGYDVFKRRLGWSDRLVSKVLGLFDRRTRR